jgi:uncharacterized protein with HEPN domain
MRREELYLADLLDNARAVRGYLDGVTRERWDTDGMLRDAVLYRMMLLGEIASALPDDLRDRHPDVAWRQFPAFRNLAVHKYFGVDWAVVWKIAQEEPSVLEKQALAIITAEFPELAKTYEPGPVSEPDTESLPGRGDAADFSQDGELLLPCPPELSGQPQQRVPGQNPARVLTCCFTLAARVGAGNRVTVVELVFSPGPGLGKFGIWLRGSRAL